MLNIYFCLLLLILCLTVYEIVSCRNNAPSKIKFLGIAALGVIFCRYVSLVVFFIIGNIRYIYLLKAFYFTSLLFIPVCGAICLYIVMRSDKVKFNWIMLFSLLCLSGYILIILKFPCHIDISSDVYIMRFHNSMLVSWIYLIVNTLLLLAAISITNKSGNLKHGVLFLIMSSSAAITEVIICMLGINLMPEPILGEFIWLLTFSYCISKLKK